MINIDKKCGIIEEFIRSYMGTNESIADESYISFITYNDLGVPLAQSVTYGLVALTEDGENLINETWLQFCAMIGIDPADDYDSIYDIFEVDEEEEDE